MTEACEGQLDEELSGKLASLVEQITTSGQAIVELTHMKELKKICKQSDEYVQQCYHQCITQLEKEHSEIRLSTFLIIDELFNRSHLFRQLLLQDFQNFMELTLEIDMDLPLPPPQKAAKVLKGKVIRAIHQWQNKFGEAYKQLSLAYNFLKTCKKVDFTSMEVRSEVERIRATQQRQRAENLQREKVQAAIKEMSDIKVDIQNCLVQAENCLQLLLPDLESFEINGLKSPDALKKDHWKSFPNKRKKSRRNSERSDGKNTSSRLIACETKGIKTELCKTANVGQADTLRQDKNDTTAIVDNQEINDNNEPSEGASHSSNSKNNHKHTNDAQGNVSEEDSEEFLEITDSDSDSSGSSEDEAGSDFTTMSDEHLESYPTGLDNVRQHGVGSHTFTLNIDISDNAVRINETEDNEDIINALRDSVQLAENKFLPAMQKYLNVFTKAGNEEYIRKAIDIRNAIENMKKNVQRLKFVKSSREEPLLTPRVKDEKSDDSDDDFEEVADLEVKEGYEAQVPDHLREEYGLADKTTDKKSTKPHWTVHDSINDVAHESDPTTFKATLRSLQHKVTEKINNTGESDHRSSIQTDNPQPSTSASGTQEQELKKKAPRVPFNIDLLHWGQEIEEPMMVSYDVDHRFWFNKDGKGEKVDKNALASMTSRVISFTGKFEPVQHHCKAPLPNGKLCPRMDRFKCPFHGKIIARDATGKPTKEEDRRRVEEEEEKKQRERTPEWEDPQLQQEIAAATGIDLTKKGKGKKGKGKGKRKYPNLTDIGPKPKTSRSRLEAKVFNPRTVKRVASKLKAIDAKKFHDKFGNQFHYAFSHKK